VTVATLFDGFARRAHALGEPRERVVLAHRADDRVAVAVPGDERGLDVGDPDVDVEPALLERLDESAGGVRLLEGGLRLLPDVQCEVGEVAPTALDRVGDAIDYHDGISHTEVKSLPRASVC